MLKWNQFQVVVSYLIVESLLFLLLLKEEPQPQLFRLLECWRKKLFSFLLTEGLITDLIDDHGLTESEIATRKNSIAFIGSLAGGRPSLGNGKEAGPELPFAKRASLKGRNHLI